MGSREKEDQTSNGRYILVTREKTIYMKMFLERHISFHTNEIILRALPHGMLGLGV
jgi:hypothetical protein